MLDTPLDDLFPELLANEYEHLSLDELVNVLRVPPPDELGGDFDTNVMPMYTGITYAILDHGSSGRKTLWAEANSAHPTALRAILMTLMDEPREQTRVRRRLLKLLEGDDPVRTVIALEGLEFSQDRKARSRVLPFVEHSHPSVRTRALNYMTSLFPADALPMVLESIDDEDSDVRMTALLDIMKLSVLDVTPRVREAAGRLRKDRDPEVRYVAGRILDNLYNPGDYGSDMLSEGLEEFQYRNGKTRPIWKDVERAEKRDDFASLFTLLTALIVADPDDQRVRAKIRALLIDPEDGTLSTSLPSHHAVDAIYLLSIVGDWEIQDVILDLRASDDLEMAEAAFAYERSLDPVAAVESNLALLDSPDSFMRSAAMEKLQDIRALEVDPDIRARVEAMRDDPDEIIRKQIEFVLQPTWQTRLAAYNVLATLE